MSSGGDSCKAPRGMSRCGRVAANWLCNPTRLPMGKKREFHCARARVAREKQLARGKTRYKARLAGDKPHRPPAKGLRGGVDVTKRGPPGADRLPLARRHQPVVLSAGVDWVMVFIGPWDDFPAQSPKASAALAKNNKLARVKTTMAIFLVIGFLSLGSLFHINRFARIPIRTAGQHPTGAGRRLSKKIC